MNPLILLLALGTSLVSQDSLCAIHTSGADPSLYCLPLLSSAAAPSATGTAVLRPARSPFGLAVTREGRPRFMVELTLSGLPSPASLGPYRSFMAWATTPQLEPFIPLGPVREGRTLLGPLDLERFIIMISAEASATGTWDWPETSEAWSHCEGHSPRSNPAGYTHRRDCFGRFASSQ